jgi:hypothetical protein
MEKLVPSFVLVAAEWGRGSLNIVKIAEKGNGRHTFQAESPGSADR